MPSTSASTESGVAAAAGWWLCRALAPNGRPQWCALVSSAAHPGGARIELRADEARVAVGGDAICFADYDDERRVSSLRVTARGASKAPPLWFVEVSESAGEPPAVNLVAFTGHDVAVGSLRDDTGGTSATTADQLGAVRWYPATGEVDQIYVQQDWRRRTVGSALVVAAVTLSYARDWPRMWSDGQRTQLGEQFRNGSEWQYRTADLTNLSPPMTPGDA